MEEQRKTIEQVVSETEHICNPATSNGLKMDKSNGEDFTVLGFSRNTASVDPNDLYTSP